MTTKTQGTRIIYLLLTRSETYFSRLIHHVTDGEYTHASLGLEGPRGPFYSFARKNPRMALPAGLIQEHADRGFFSLHPHIPCCLYELEVSEDTYRFLCRRLEVMYRNRERYHYSLLGTLACFFRLPFARRHHKFCSEFVAEMLCESGAVELGKDPCLTRPMDFCSLSDLRPIHQGEVGGLMGSVA